MEATMLFDGFLELPDGYQVQLMVLRDYPGGRARRGKPSVYRSRVWIGHATESEPLDYRSQEHKDLQVAIDACYSLLLIGARAVVHSPVALEAIQQQAHEHFSSASSNTVKPLVLLAKTTGCQPTVGML